MIKRLILTTVALGFSLLASAQAPEHIALPGKTYALIDPPAQNIRTSDASNVEVVEIFAYTCSHCYALEAPVANWLKTKNEAINFVRLPMPGEGIWEIYAKTYFTLEAMGVVDKGHPAIFNAIWKDRKRFKNKEEITKFMTGAGIDEKEFLKTWDSFAVTSSFNRALDLTTKQYRIGYTPVFIVDGRYLIDGTTSQADSYEGIVEAVNQRALEVLEEKKSASKEKISE